MKLNTPKAVTFWVAVGIAALSFVVYIVHLVDANIPMMGAIGYLVLLIAFVLLCMGLLLKNL